MYSNGFCPSLLCAMLNIESSGYHWVMLKIKLVAKSIASRREIENLLNDRPICHWHPY